MRVDEREISGASESVADAPDLIELRVSSRCRVPKRQWEQELPSQPRKRTRKSTQNPTPTSSTAPDSTPNYAPPTVTICKDEPPESASQAASQSTSQTASESASQTASQRQRKKEKDYLVDLIGSDEFPDVLNIPVVPPEVLIDQHFQVENPLSIWQEFITPSDLKYLANHTNENAAINQREQQARPGAPYRHKRRWKKVTAVEIGSYIGALFLLGTQGAASLRDNWSVLEDSLVYPIQRYISLERFEQISRYFKVNSPSNNDLSDNEFWRKVDPLVSSFRDRSRANLRPGTVFAIDEQLRRNRGRWKHALQISSKADGKGVKIYSLCQGYYCFDFLFASKVVGVPEVQQFKAYDTTAKAFPTSESVILTLIHNLQKSHDSGRDYSAESRPLHLTLACDNFFTTHKLFADLKVRGIAAYGTAKQGSGIPAQHVKLRDVTDKATDYGLTCNSVYNGVNHVTFVDQKAIHMMTTAHDVKNQAPLLARSCDTEECLSYPQSGGSWAYRITVSSAV